MDLRVVNRYVIQFCVCLGKTGIEMFQIMKNENKEVYCIAVTVVPAHWPQKQVPNYSLGGGELPPG
jgi:hypothetical protein